MTYKSPTDFKELKGLLDEVPIKLVPILNKLELTVFKAPLKLGISGKLLKNNKLPDTLKEQGGKSGWTILVNKDEPSRRVRFTIAHEIAHFLLHKDILEEYGRIVDDTRYRSEQISDYKETEANQFAADLLMPWNKLEETMKNKDSITLSQMADTFQVSEIAMAIRLGVDA